MDTFNRLRRKVTASGFAHDDAYNQGVWDTLKATHRPEEKAPSPKTPEGHKARHGELHKALDELFADFIMHHRDRVNFLDTTYRELMEWSHRQTIHPDELS